MVRKVVNVERFAADNAALALATGDDSGMACLSTGCREDALSDGHSANVLGARLAAH